jgi:hypothetical protein
MSYNNGPRIITNGLVLCLDAGNPKSYPGIGTSWVDLSGNGNNGTLTNGPAFNSSNTGSIVFDGINDYCDTPLTYGGTNSCSFGCFMKAPDATQRSGLIGFRSQFFFLAPSISQCLIYITGDNDAGTAGRGLVVQDWIGGYSGNNFVISTNRTVYAINSNVCDNLWHNIMITRSSSATRLFIDNILIGETLGSTPNIMSDPIFKLGVAGNGGSNNLSGYHFNGSLGLCYFYNRALSASEVSQNYNAIKGRFNL